MKIAAGPTYQKRGSPLQQRQRRTAQLAAQLFAELLPHVYRKGKAKQAAPKSPRSLRLPREE